MVDLGSGSQREIDDIMLTRYACYLIAQNGDSRKKEIAFAQTYFAMQTGKAELIEQRLLETERVSARKKLSVTEKELSDIVFEQAGGNQNFGLIRSKGDSALEDRSKYLRKAKEALANIEALKVAFNEGGNTVVLRRGSFGSAVAELQELLIDKGFNLAIDADYGAATELAVLMFQKDNGLIVDGIVGQQTWEQLRQ